MGEAAIWAHSMRRMPKQILHFSVLHHLVTARPVCPVHPTPTIRFTQGDFCKTSSENHMANFFLYNLFTFQKRCTPIVPLDQQFCCLLLQISQNKLETMCEQSNMGQIQDKTKSNAGQPGNTRTSFVKWCKCEFAKHGQSKQPVQLCLYAFAAGEQ